MDSKSSSMLECSKCSFKTSSTIYFKKHMTHKHSIEIKIKDPKFSTDSKFSLRIFCSECSFKAANSQILKNHMKRFVFFIIQYIDLIY